MENKTLPVVELPNMVGNIYEFSYTPESPRELFFKSERSLVQQCRLFPGSNFVCDFSLEEDEFTLQVLFPLIFRWDYNHYLLILYFWDKKEILMTAYLSHTKYPPVWDRAFSCGPDYTDYVAIQQYVNPILSKRVQRPIHIDDNPVGKAVNCIAGPIDEAEKAIAEGQPYKILSFRADAQEHIIERKTMTL